MGEYQELIATVVSLLVTGLIGALVWLHRITKANANKQAEDNLALVQRVTVVETEARAHSTADDKAHARLLEAVREIKSEVSLSRAETTESIERLRAESTTQHGQLRQMLTDRSAELHTRIDGVGQAVAGTNERLAGMEAKIESVRDSKHG